MKQKRIFAKAVLFLGKSTKPLLPAYKVRFSPQVIRNLRRMEERQRELHRRVVAAIDSLAEDPSQGKSLEGRLKGSYSYRVGPYRIIYRIYRLELMILIIDVGHRGEVYR